MVGLLIGFLSSSAPAHLFRSGWTGSPICGHVKPRVIDLPFGDLGIEDGEILFFYIHDDQLMINHCISEVHILIVYLHTSYYHNILHQIFRQTDIIIVSNLSQDKNPGPSTS